MLKRSHFISAGSALEVLSTLLSLAAISLSSVSAIAQIPASVPIRISGRVVDLYGAPVSAATVSVPAAGATSISQVRTNDSGQFRIELDTFVEKEILLTVRAEGFSQQERKLKLTDSRKSSPHVITLDEITLYPAPLEEQLTVTAARAETQLSDTPASVIVLTQQALASTASLTIDDTLRQVPGFQLFRRSGSRTANPTTQGVSLRAVGASGASRALVLLDGVPLNDPFGGWVYWSRVPRESLQTVEVLRGAASSLYGSSALGGVVNLISRTPSSSVASLELSYGNQQTPQASFFAATKQGGWGASLGAEMFNTDGYVLVEDSVKGRVDTAAGARHSTFDVMIERSFAKAGRLFVRGSVFGESRRNGTPLQTNRTHLRQMSGGVDWSGERVGEFSLRGYAIGQVYDQVFTAIAADRESETITRLQRVPSQSTGASFQWVGRAGRRQTLVSGIEARDVRGASDEVAYAGGRPTSLIGSGGRERTIGVFIEDIVAVTQRLVMTGVLRFDRRSNLAGRQTTRPVTSGASGVLITFPDRVETAFSPQASALFRLNDSIAFHAAAQRAFRAPTLNELYRSFRVGDVVTLANAGLRAERLISFEGGTSVQSRRRQVSARATFFWSELDQPVANVTLSVTPTLVTRRRENLGATRSRGIEFDGEARLSDRVRMSAGYFFADAVVKSFPPNSSLVGLLIPQIPRHQFAAQLTYSDKQSWLIGIQGRGASSQFDDDQNRLLLARFFNLDARVERELRPGLRLFAALENMLGQRYETGRTPVLTLGPPVLTRFGLRLSVGKK